MTLNDFHTFVVDYLKSRPEQAGKDINLAPDTDLIGAGIVDSFAFIDLCLAIEQKTGAIIDFAELPIEQYTTIQALFDLAMSQASKVA